MFEDKDFETIHEWRKERGLDDIKRSLYPLLGVIDDSVAGFLTQTDSKLGLLEHFIADPKSDKVKRKKSIVKIGLELERLAKTLGIENLAVFTTSETIKQACLENGYKEAEKHYLLGKEL